MLKNKLGVIDVEKSEMELAKSLGVTRDALSREGQVQSAHKLKMESYKIHLQQK